MKINDFKNNYKLNIRIITLSDRASRGEYEDLSGKYIEKEINNYFLWKEWNFDLSKNLIPDSEIEFKNCIEKTLADKVDILFTTGGTGIGPRDITIETIKPYITKEIPGVMEYIRVKYGEKLPNALLSRSIAGLMQQTLIFALPGSLKAVKDYMTEILNILEHSIFMQHQIDVH